MPISTSPYQNNDYQAASVYQPYKLPTQAIAQTAMALDQFWKAGAARVKAASDSVLNLNLTSDENKDIRDQFMKDAQAQLTKLASGDLSNPDVQREGLNIFKPIFQDKSIMQDDHLTNLKSSIFADADRYKRDVKTGGSGFHVDNLADALEGFQGFNNKTSRNQIDDIYEAAKDSQYVPYYDDTKERMDIVKLCKGNKLSSMTANAGYLDTYTNNSVSQQTLYGCLEGALSERSKQQNRISGSVRYGHDYQAVKQDYIDSTMERLDFYKDTRDSLNAEKEAKSKIAGNEDEVKALQSQIDAIDRNIRDVGFQLNGNPNASNPSEKVGIMGWDDNYMKQNYRDLAANAYFKRKNGAFAQAFATQEIATKKQGDPKYAIDYVQNELNRREIWRGQNAFDLENLKFQHKLSLGTDENGTKIDNLTRLKLCAQTLGCSMAQFMTEAYKEEATTSGKIEGQINTLNGQKFDILKDLKNDPFVKSIAPSITNIGDATAYNDGAYKAAWDKLNTYSEHADDSDPNKQKILDITNKLLEIDNRKTSLGGILDDAQTEVSKSNPQLKVNYDKESSRILSSTKSEKLFDGSIIDPQRAAAIIAGQDSELKVIPYTDNNPAPGSAPGADMYPVYDKQGKQQGWFYNNRNTIKDYEFLNSSTKGSYKSALDKYLGESTAVQKMGLSTGNLFTKDSPGERDLQTLFGQNLGIIGQSESGKGVVFSTIGGIDPITGRVKIQATDKDGLISFKRLKTALSKNNIGNSQYGTEVKDNPDAMEITLPTAIKDITPLFQEPKYSDVIRLNLNYLENKVKAGLIPPEGTIHKIGVDKSGISYSIKVAKKIGTNLPQYTMIVTGNGKSQEVPFKNTRGMDEKENILIQLDQRLNGIDNTNKQ